MRPSTSHSCADDPDAPELRYYDLLSELDSLTRYLLTLVEAPFAPVIYLDGTELESRFSYRRWGPAERRGDGRPDRRTRGRRAEDLVPAWAAC